MTVPIKKTETNSTIAVNVNSTKPTGYRRAGFALTKGDNTLNVNKAQYEQLEQDSNLSIEAIGLDDAESVPETEPESVAKKTVAKKTTAKVTAKSTVK